jgi:hypothetical protein
MQADEIIQRKEWFELNAEERSSIEELAATEQEFNLLKKMLQVSAEENTAVPMVETHVKEELRAMVATKGKSYRRYWYAAAAAILLFIAGAIFLQKEKHQDIPLVKVDTPVNTNSPVIVKKDDQPIAVPDNVLHPQTKTIDTIRIAKVLPQQNNPDTDRNDVVDNLQVYASVSKTVSEEKELLDLVTEIY